MRVARLLAVVGLVSGCTAVPSQTVEPSESPRGGTLRVVMPGDQENWSRFVVLEGDPATLDPHLDAFASYDTSELLRCCLARTLLSTNGRATADGGARIHPDAAEALPEISADGLSWAFTLKTGLHYGPPMEDVEITAPDFIRSFHRLMSPALADDSFAREIYGDIVGAQEFMAGEAPSISGLESPDRFTLVLRLTKPAGDLAPRLALPLVVPIPPSLTNPQAPFGVADGHDDGYGRFLVPSGPYMLEGSEDVDLALPPAQQQPVAGLVPGQRISLVRNPAWDRSTDELRAAHPDTIELRLVPTLDEAAEEIYAARADLLLNYGAVQQIPDSVVDSLSADPNRGRIFINEADFTAGIMMNLAMPPFDDIHVRRAIAFTINRARIVELIGGPLVMRVAHHLVPDSLEDNLLVDYRPYASPDDAGDIDAAKAEMRQSVYDTDGDGMCDADACRGIVGMSRELEPLPAVAQSVRDDLLKIGIEVDLNPVPEPDFFAPYVDPTQRVGMFIPIGWVKDALSPANFFVATFYGPTALAVTGNGTLVGATAEQLEDWGYDITDVPNIDSRIEACLPLTGSAQFDCWAGLDQYVMENVVPTVPYGTGVGLVAASRRVVEYVWDQGVGAPSFDRIVLAQ